MSSSDGLNGLMAPDIFESKHFNIFHAIAMSLANEGHLVEAIRLDALLAKICRWQGKNSNIKYYFSLIHANKIVTDLVELERLNPNQTELKSAIVSQCNFALEPFDYRIETWSMLAMTVFSDQPDRNEFRLSQLSNDLGRSLFWLNVPLVNRANRSDMLKAYLAEYQLIQRDPHSVDQYDLGSKEKIRVMATGNSLTRALRMGFVPYNISASIRHELDLLKLMKAKYE
jgi:hypothetical protein